MTEKCTIIHVIEGRVTDPGAHSGGANIGDVEWQFSDGPPGERGESSDYLDLEEGLRDYPDCLFRFYPLERSYDLEMTVLSTVRVQARSEAEARRILWGLDGNEANYGEFPNGDPVCAPIHIQNGVRLTNVE